MLGMWPQSRVSGTSIRLGGPGGRIDPIRPLAERRWRSPHDQADPGFELATFCLKDGALPTEQLRYLACNNTHENFIPFNYH